MKMNLLDRLAQRTGASYLSDLHGSVANNSICSAVKEISPEEYPVEEWADAVGYITGQEHPHFENGDSARNFLCDRLSENDRVW